MGALRSTKRSIAGARPKKRSKEEKRRAWIAHELREAAKKERLARLKEALAAQSAASRAVVPPPEETKP